MMLSYHTKTLAITDLPSELKNEMSQLYFKYYAGSDETRFLADLEKKDDVILLYHQELLVGFTTLEMYLSDCPNGFTPLSPYQDASKLRIIFSGDTIVSPEHWGQQALAFSWIKYIGKIKNKYPNEPLYWLLLVKGFRTYKYLSAFSRSFYPHWEINRTDLKIPLALLSKEKYGDLYNVESDIVECPLDYGYLKHDLGTPEDKDLQNPATAFFLQKNTAFAQGHELTCLCELEPDNMRPLTLRVFLKERQNS